MSERSELAGQHVSERSELAGQDVSERSELAGQHVTERSERRVVAGIRPAPTDEEAVAIVAALEAAWPRAVAVGEAPAPRWRWSGRWWSKPVALSRRRPW